MVWKIRKITVKEVARLQEFSVKTYRQTFEPFNTEKNMAEYLADAYNLSKLTQEIATVGTTFYFIEENKVIGGYLKLNVGSAIKEVQADNPLEVERLYVDAAFKRRGLGQKLMEFAISEAQRAQKDNLWLGVWENNQAAKAFYEKMGFVYTSAHDFVMGDDVQTDLIMVKSLKK
jgi:ribosomal protein S18 acetylase RimI-like enzyme